MSILRLIGLIIALLAAPLTVTAYATEQPDAWPCEQVFVAEISAAVLWAGPSLDKVNPHAWRSDVPVAKLVREIISQFASAEKIEMKISTFVKTLPLDQKDQKLTLVFSGVLGVLNARRAKYMKGILKFSSQQAARAKLIDEGLSALTKLKAANTSGEKAKALEEKLIWQQRMFDDRERSIRFLCEQPTNVETAMADLARTLFNELDQ